MYNYVMTFVFSAEEIEGVIAARQIISGSRNPELAKLGFDTEPGDFPYYRWMELADLVLEASKLDENC